MNLYKANLSCSHQTLLNSSLEMTIGAHEMYRIGYFTAWSVYDPKNTKPISELVATLGLTHLIYAFGIMEEKTGRFCLHDAYAAFDKGIIQEFKKVKKDNPGIHIGISIGGWNHRHQLKLIMQNPTVFIKSLVEFVRLHEFDFVDLDWEFDSPEVANSSTIILLKFTKILQEQLVPDSKYLTLALSGSTQYLNSIKCFEAYVKLFHLMTYNYSGPWSPTPTAFAPLYQGECVDAAVHCLLKQEIQSKKIVIGVSGFGILFNDGAVRDISVDCKELKGAEKKWDAQRCFMLFKTKSGRISIESPQSFKKKEDYVKELGLAGIFIWDISAFYRLMYSD